MLNYRTAGEGRPLVIVHGLFGSGDNWQTVAGKFPGWKAYLPDLRNHGESPWLDAFNLPAIAGDLADFARELSLPLCPWIGHSLGGKALMELALTHPDRVSGIAVLDMTPKQSVPRYPGFVAALLGLDLETVTGRTDAQAKLEPHISDKATLQFLLKSLVPDRHRPGRWRWRLNLEILDRDYAEIWKALEPGRSWDGPALFLYGGASDYFQPGDEVLARSFFPRAAFAEVPGAGHWLHAEKPAEVVNALTAWLEEVS